MAASTSIASDRDSADGSTEIGAESRLRIPIGDDDGRSAGSCGDMREHVVIIAVSLVPLAALMRPELRRSLPVANVSVKSSALYYNRRRMSLKGHMLHFFVLSETILLSLIPHIYIIAVAQPSLPPTSSQSPDQHIASYLPQPAYLRRTVEVELMRRRPLRALP